MKIRLNIAGDITKEYSLPRELGALCADCWNAGHDGVALDEVKLVDESQAKEN
jgi:hypothetical protein